MIYEIDWINLYGVAISYNNSSSSSTTTTIITSNFHDYIYLITHKYTFFAKLHKKKLKNNDKKE